LPGNEGCVVILGCPVFAGIDRWLPAFTDQWAFPRSACIATFPPAEYF